MAQGEAQFLRSQRTLRKDKCFGGRCSAWVYFTLPPGESSRSEERATAPSPPLADARPSRCAGRVKCRLNNT